MGKKSRDKGKLGERETAKALESMGFKTSRPDQSGKGLEGGPDVLAIRDDLVLAVESKRTAKTWPIMDALDSADEAANAMFGETAKDVVPVARIRRDREPPVWVMSDQAFAFLMAHIRMGWCPVGAVE